MFDDQKYVSESFQDPRTLKLYLQDVIDGIERGRLVFHSEGEDEVVLRPSPFLKVSVKAKKKGSGGKLNFSISWRDAEGADAVA